MADTHRTHRGTHALHPETLMLGYGYDPALSEGSVKPPVFQRPVAGAAIGRREMLLPLRLLRGGQAAAFRFLNALRIFELAVGLGGSQALAAAG